MERMRYAVYKPPRKGLPYLAVGMVGETVECLLAADTRVEAREKLGLEMEILQTKSRLFEKYARDLSLGYAGGHDAFSASESADELRAR